MANKKVILVGYSGHAFVVADILLENGYEILGYCEGLVKENNPFDLPFLGPEHLLDFGDADYFVGVGDNVLRGKIIQNLFRATGKKPILLQDKKASVSSKSTLGRGTLLGNGCIVNACAKIGEGVICNTQSVIEHECEIGDYAHIAPGAVLCGNVKVGARTFIGAKSVVKQGVSIGEDVIVGAGTVVIKDIPSHSKIVGNPQKFI